MNATHDHVDDSQLGEIRDLLQVATELIWPDEYAAPYVNRMLVLIGEIDRRTGAVACD